MEDSYHLVLFNVDKPAVPSEAKTLHITKLMYDNVMAGVQWGFHLGKDFYEVTRWRAFDSIDEKTGTKHFLIVDVKKT